MKKLPYLLVLSGLISAPAIAEDAAPASPFSLSGYVDATYTSFNKNENTAYAGSSTINAEPQRQFDYRKDSLVLNQAAITVSYLPTTGFGGLVNVIAGSDARVLRNTEVSSGNTSSSGLDIYQGYGQYANGPYSVLAGKFATLAGAETVNPTTNTTISRSMLFYDLEPLSHTGLRAAYAGSAATVTVGINNGWNYTGSPKIFSGSSISGKTMELGISATPSKMYSFSGAVYSGEAPSGNGHGTKNLYDLVATINATDALSFVLNYDYVTQKNNTGTGGTSKADGLAAYVNYTFNDQWSLTGRGEFLQDKDGALTGTTGNKLKEFTLALNYSPLKSTTLRAEVRQDKSSSNGPIFDTGMTATSQTSIELEGIYKF